jgi:hypothetical protein
MYGGALSAWRGCRAAVPRRVASGEEGKRMPGPDGTYETLLVAGSKQWT